MDGLDGTAVNAWVRAARDALAVAHERIDAVNVFPVPDADTGTNVLLTFDGACRELDDVPARAGAGQVARAAAHGALLAARGNSGVIVSQYLSGLARGLPEFADARALAGALDAAARSARGAVAEPQEGTVLTVAQDVADGARLAADAGADLDALLAGVLAEAHRSLARISAQHPVLRAAHVLDAGACALLVVLDALARVVRGAGPASADDLAWLPTGRVAGEQHDDGGAYEVMLLVRGPVGPDTARPAARVAAPDVGAVLRERVGALGDSVAVVGADGWWHVHVHTDDPAAVIAACAVGAREQVVVRLVAAGHPGTSGLVVCTGSAGLAAWYAALGAVVVVHCPEAPVSGRHLERAVVDAGAGPVTVLTGGVVAPDDVPALNGLEDLRGPRALDDRQVPPAGAGAANRTRAVEVVETADELTTAVAALALAGSVPHAHAGTHASDAVARLRSAPVDRHLADTADAAAGPTWSASGPDGVVGRTLDVVDTLLRRWPDGTDRPEHVTVLHGEDLPEDVPALAAALDAALADRHPELELLVLGPAAGSGVLQVGVD